MGTQTERRQSMASHELLPMDIWEMIGLKLGAADRIRFRAVSKSWISLIPSRQPPWLLLVMATADSEDEADKPSHRFACIAEDNLYDFHLQNLLHDAICVGSTGDWLVTAHADDTIRLLNPFSKQQIYGLPAQSMFEDPVTNRWPHLSFCKIIVSSTPSDGRNCIAMAIHGTKENLAFARLGDTNWTTLQHNECTINRPALAVQDIIYYKHKFYAITASCRLLECDTGDCPRAICISDTAYDGMRKGMLRSRGGAWVSVTKGANLSEPVERPWRQVYYLVEWLGELLLVVKYVEQYRCRECTTTNLQVYRFDFLNRKWSRLKSLGEHSLFLGTNTSISARASDYFGLVERNCIYFTDDCRTKFQGSTKASDQAMGVFDMEDSRIRPLMNGASTNLCSPPVWIVPN